MLIGVVDTNIPYETFDASSYCSFIGKGSVTGEKSNYVAFKVFEEENHDKIIGVVGTEYRAVNLVTQLNTYGYNKCMDSPKYTYKAISMFDGKNILTDEKYKDGIVYKYYDLFEIVKIRDNKGNFVHDSFPFLVAQEKTAFEHMIALLEDKSRFFALRTCLIPVINVQTYDSHKCNGCRSIKFVNYGYYTCVNSNRKVRENMNKKVICLYYNKA